MQRILLSLVILLIVSFGYSQHDDRLAKGLSPIEQIKAVQMPLQDNAALMEAELARRGPAIAPRYATNISVDLDPSKDGVWESTPDGMVWRLRIHSADAFSINLGFTEYFMPKGGKLLLYTPDYKEVRGPFTPADNEEHEQLWTPLLDGDEIVIEVQLPEEVADQLRLKLSYVNHAFESFSSLISGSCNLDVICGQADGWGIVDPHRNIIQSVAVISTGGGTFCTGFLVNNVENDCTPFFMTAFHCGINASNAPSLVTYWNYQNSTCRQPFSTASGQPGDGQLNDFNTGSIFRARRSASDFVLVELDDPVSPTANAYLAGWDASGADISSSIAIHHPRTDEKRISFEDDPSQFTTYGGTTSTPNFTHVRVVDWDVGTTEPGSSGSPLFDQNQRVVGQLHGGGAACGNNLSDWYGAFAVSWDAGGNSSSRLRDWLDPNNTGTLTIDGRWANDCGFSLTATPSNQEVCIPDDAYYDIEVSGDFGGTVTLSAENLPPGTDAFFSPTNVQPGEIALLTVTTSGADPGEYNFTVVGESGGDSGQVTLGITILPDPFTPPNLFFPDNNSIDVYPNPTLSWDGDDSGAITYEVQIATDINFNNIVETGMTTGTSYQPVNANIGNTQYFWRVRGSNSCGTGFWSDEFNFTTDFISCTTYSSQFSSTISTSGTPSIENDIDFAEMETIASVSVNMEITHTYVGDLDASLLPPGGGSISLFDRPGQPGSNFGCSEDNLRLGFSDDSPNSAALLENTCNDSETGLNNPGPPYAIAGSYQPIDDFTSLVGAGSNGTWTLQVNDNASSDGGILEGWSITICYEIPSDPPFIVTNEMLTVPHNTAETITNQYLEAGDDMSAADEIEFVLTDMPNEGMLFLDGMMLNLGDSFTQADIDAGSLSYQHEGGIITMDEFYFDLVNSAGLVSPSHVFLIEILIEQLTVDYNQLTENLCNGDSNASLEVIAGGGVMPYEYALNDGEFQDENIFTGLAAGSYSVSVMDMTGNIVSSVDFLIMQPDELMASAGVDMDDITVSALGGTAPYTYQLDDNAPQDSPTFNDLANGQYTITVTDANDCQTMITATVAVNTLVISASITQEIDCHGANNGIITATVSGGTPTYQYRINGGAWQADSSFPGLQPGMYTVEVQDQEGFMQTSNTLTVTAPAELTLSASVDETTISLTAGGGTPPFSYQLEDNAPQDSPVFTMLANGTYTLHVIDANGCSTSVQATVSVNTLVVSANLDNDISCNDANDAIISVNVSGGTMPYQYSLDGINYQVENTFPGLSAGSYTVTVLDSEGFTMSTNTITVTNPSAIMGSAIVDEQTITVTASGGTAPLMYQLNDGMPQSNPSFTDLPNGDYTVTVIDANGCILELSATVSVNTLVVSATLSSDISCHNANDGILSANVSGGTPPYQYSLDGINYQAENTFSGLAAGSYTVTVLDGEGFTQTTNAVSITNPDALAGLLSLAENDITVSATGGTPPLMYQLNDGTPQSDPTFMDLPNGDYTITIIDANGCELELTTTIAINTLEVSAALVNGISCFDANDALISVSATGGTPPLQYSIDGQNYQAENTFPDLGPGTYTVTVLDSEGFTQTTNSITISNPSELVGSVMVDENNISVNASGGTAPLMYQLNDMSPQDESTFSNLPNGEYLIQVIDANGCTLSFTETISINTLEVSIVLVSDISCFNVPDGVVSATVAGGTPPYQYSLDGVNFQADNSFGGLAPGEYSITVLDAEGFTQQTTTVTLTNPEMLTMNVEVDDATITIDAEGGTGMLSYSVDGLNFQPEPVFTDLPDGVYQVTVRDENGCAVVMQVIIGSSLAATFDILGTIGCAGDSDISITVNASGGTPPYEYSIDGGATWQTSPVFENISAGTYEVTVRDDMGDTFTSPSIAISEPPPVILEGEVDGDDIVLMATGGSAPYLYSLDGITYTSSNVFSDLPPGDYTLWVEDANGCVTTTEVSILVGIFDPTVAELSLLLYPNPNSGQFYLRLEQSEIRDLTIQVFDPRGRLIQQDIHQRAGLVFERYFDLSALPAGLYQIVLSDGERFGRAKVAVIK